MSDIVNPSTIRSRKHRERDGNSYDRARGRVARRAAMLYKAEHPDEWWEMMDAELAKLRPGPSPDA